MKATSPAAMNAPEITSVGATARQSNGRLTVDVLRHAALARDLAHDVRTGMRQRPKRLPPKYFYDDRGSQLFDAICDLPEYYLTRAGQALLQRCAPEIIALTQPAQVVELGSGTARTTRALFDVLARRGGTFRYLPFDVSEGMLRQAALGLLHDYPMLRIHAVVGDYEQDLDRLPAGRRRLVLFLGSTIGNFTPEATATFLSAVRHQLSAGEHFLIGVDLVKPVDVLEAAYNDSAGVTAEFNRNVLRVINRHLDANFQPQRFDHVAFFNREASQIEMHLRARARHTVTIRVLDMVVPFDPGETIHTEISRKFSATEVQSMLNTAGFDVMRWYTPPDQYFALALARAV